MLLPSQVISILKLKSNRRMSQCMETTCNENKFTQYQFPIATIQSSSSIFSHSILKLPAVNRLVNALKPCQLSMEKILLTHFPRRHRGVITKIQSTRNVDKIEKVFCPLTFSFLLWLTNYFQYFDSFFHVCVDSAPLTITHQLRDDL